MKENIISKKVLYSQIIVITDDGETFLLDRQGDNYIVRSYFDIEEEIFHHTDTFPNLIDEFKLIGIAITIKK